MIALIQAFCADAFAQTGRRVQSITLEPELFDRAMFEVKRSRDFRPLDGEVQMEIGSAEHPPREVWDAIEIQIAGASVIVRRGR